MPRRSYSTNNIFKPPDIEKMNAKIEFIKNIPQPEQRTDEWYKFRYKYLTASSIWKAFISESTRNQLIYSKCQPLDISKYQRTAINSPLHWGHKYEPLSVMWYEKYYITIVTDFGCIPHTKHNFLAASPDGINTDSNSERFGRMLEIKNIVNRTINGIPKMEYWIQMQLQMETCNLNECDFLETRFIEYNSYDDFINDGTFVRTNEDKLKGIMIYFSDDNGNPIYEYAPLEMNNIEFEIWENNIMEKNSHLNWIRNIYWKLDQVSCVLVLRNKTWFKSSLSTLYDLWKIIEKEKVHGYEHRAPKRKLRGKNVENSIFKKCCIDTSNLTLNNKDVDMNNNEDQSIDSENNKKEAMDIDNNNNNIIINIVTEINN